ncbi:MAG: sulfatase-like hydrolase/transferase [Polyangiaceae bacterium]|nr:sulfatase-like hydrolase/transferase [Polyangiaceae bacterium]
MAIARALHLSNPRTRTTILVVTALLPPLLLTALDAFSRRGALSARTGPSTAGYVGGAVLGAAVWALGLEAARAPKRSVRVSACIVLGLTAAFGIGGQALFRSTTHEYFNREAAVFSIRLWPTIVHYLSLSPGPVSALLLGPFALAIAYALFRNRVAGTRTLFPGLIAGLALLAWLFATFGPLDVPSSRRGLPPDVLFWHAAGGLGLSAAGILPKPRALPPGNHAQVTGGSPVKNNAPSIVLILGESVRRDEVCSRPSPSCKKSPRVDLAAPDRVGFTLSFSIASCTEIAGAVLWSGLDVRSPREHMQTAPLLWDYAKARGYKTGYFAAQNLGFADQALFVRSSRIDVFREARDRDPHVDADIGSPDEVAAAEAIAFLTHDAPAFVVLHLSNTHLPYRQVPGYTPYDGEGDEPSHKRARYLNSLAHHDATVGDFVTAIRRLPRGKDAIVVYTADHGEAWGEHQSFTHTFDLYAEQVDIPLWIDAPAGTISTEARGELMRAGQNRPFTTPDITATVLDFMGALDESDYSVYTSALAGKSALRPAQNDTFYLSNCPPYRSCYPDAWGVVKWPFKWHYVGRANEWVCSNIETDPEELRPLPAETCASLRELLPAPNKDLPVAPTLSPSPPPTPASTPRGSEK